MPKPSVADRLGIFTCHRRNVLGSDELVWHHFADPIDDYTQNQRSLRIAQRHNLTKKTKAY